MFDESYNVREVLDDLAERINLRRLLQFLVMILALIVIPAWSVAPAAASKATFSCSVSVIYASLSRTLYVTTRLAATGGYIPNPAKTDFLFSYKNGLIYDSQVRTFEVPHKTDTAYIVMAVPSNGMGVYTFQSLIMEHRKNLLASCSGTYNL